MTEDESRKAFESWLRTWYLSELRLPQDDEGAYVSYEFQENYESWKAAIAWMQSQQAWRPMDSAPRDESKILLCDGYDYCVAKWLDGGWYEVSNREGLLYAGLTGWKGWLPLPPLPEEEK